MSGVTDRPVVRRSIAGIDWLAAKVNDRIAIDLRALAALRIALGSLVLVDLLLRSRNFVAFYTRRGVYPLSYLNDPLEEPYSVHAFSGSFEFQAFLFVVAGVFALFLLFGYRTRFATVVSWFLLLSLQHRNPLVLNSGDVLLRMLLFWGIFLPLGERWSLGVRRFDRDRDVVASLATLAIMVQVVLVYSVNSVHKLKSDEWIGGTAVATVMNLEHFSVYLGPTIAEFPLLLRFVTYTWVILIVASPLLLVLNGWPRVVLATGLAGTHLGMALSMQIGLFPLVSIVSLLVFCPPFLWDRLDGVLAEYRVQERLGALLDRLDALDPLPGEPIRPKRWLPDDVPAPGAVVATALLLVLIPSVILSGAASTDYGDTPEVGQDLLDHTEMGQSWQMFAPNPADTSRWYYGTGNTTDGTEVDPFLGGTPTRERPANPADTVRTARWRKYLVFVQGRTPYNYQDYFGNYLCEEWNRTHDTQLANVSVSAMQYEVGPDGRETEPERDVVVSEYDCTGDLIQA